MSGKQRVGVGSCCFVRASYSCRICRGNRARGINRNIPHLTFCLRCHAANNPWVFTTGKTIFGFERKRFSPSFISYHSQQLCVTIRLLFGNREPKTIPNIIEIHQNTRPCTIMCWYGLWGFELRTLLWDEGDHGGDAGMYGWSRFNFGSKETSEKNFGSLIAIGPTFEYRKAFTYASWVCNRFSSILQENTENTCYRGVCWRHFSPRPKWTSAA